LSFSLENRAADLTGVKPIQPGHACEKLAQWNSASRTSFGGFHRAKRISPGSWTLRVLAVMLISAYAMEIIKERLSYLYIQGCPTFLKNLEKSIKS
jgi:hypothetical protein